MGVWLWVLNRFARYEAVWPRTVTQLGLLASGFMLSSGRGVKKGRNAR